MSDNYNNEYLDLADELMFFLLRNTNDGLKLKKAFSPINLYYGLKPGKNMNTDYHRHPTYTMGGVSSDASFGKCVFHEHKTCTICKANVNDREIFKTIINPMIRESIDLLMELDLPKLIKFIKSHLIYMNPSKRIIHDLMFVKIFINAGGYSRSNQGEDFKGLEEMLERNEKFRQSDLFDKSQNALGNQMYEFGRNVAVRLVSSGRYPNAQHFQRNLTKWLTSRSAGRTSITVTAEINGNVIKQTSTSKKTYAMMEGERVLDLSTVKEISMSFQEYFKTLNDDQLELLKRGDKGAISTMLLNTGTFKIGSRSVVAYRPVRPIYLVVLALHLAFACTIGPIVDEISYSEQYTENQNRRYLIGEDKYNGVIATQHMDGSLDVIAPAVMASANSNTLALKSDSSNFDQTSINETSNLFLRGVQRGFLDVGINRDEKYMYHENVGKNLIEIMDFLIKAINRRHYYVEYLNQALQYNIDYLSSGRLDTFYMNSVKNAIMHKNFILKILDKYKGIVDLSWMQVAGDDGIIIFNLDGNITSSQIK